MCQLPALVARVRAPLGLPRACVKRSAGGSASWAALENTESKHAVARKPRTRERMRYVRTGCQPYPNCHRSTMVATLRHHFRHGRTHAGHRYAIYINSSSRAQGSTPQGGLKAQVVIPIRRMREGRVCGATIRAFMSLRPRMSCSCPVCQGSPLPGARPQS